MRKDEISIFKNESKPFLKWAGGKKQLLSELDYRLPKELKEGKITRYVEPFVGAGALLFHIDNYYPVDEYVICDINKELIVCYTAIKNDPDSVIKCIKQLADEYYKLDEQEQSTGFYNIRQYYNDQLNAFDFNSYNRSWTIRTAMTIFLNRTCFNGLFRVNSSGAFNVPFGKYKKPAFYDEDNIYAVNKVLQKTRILSGDFELTAGYIDARTFVYLDPPYRPLNQTSSFTSYTEHEFDDDTQKRLAYFYKNMSNRGAKLMLSNSDPKNTNPNDHFFEELFTGYEIDHVNASRMINCNGAKRGQISELIVMNY